MAISEALFIQPLAPSAENWLLCYFIAVILCHLEVKIFWALCFYLFFRQGIFQNYRKLLKFCPVLSTRALLLDLLEHLDMNTWPVWASQRGSFVTEPEIIWIICTTFCMFVCPYEFYIYGIIWYFLMGLPAKGCKLQELGMVVTIVPYSWGSWSPLWAVIN